MKPLFYRCCTDRALRQICFLICTWNLVFEILFIWLLVVTSEQGSGPVSVWWISFWYLLPDVGISVVNHFIFYAVEVPFTIAATFVLFLGAFSASHNLVMVSAYTQLLVLITESVLMCYMLFWHQMTASAASGLIAMALFIWLRLLCYFVTTSYAEQLIRNTATDNIDYMTKSFVMMHLKKRAEATRQPVTSTLPVDEKYKA